MSRKALKITEISELCNISRPTIYKHIEENLCDYKILKRYTTPIKLRCENEDDPMTIDLNEIKKIVKKMVVGYQESLSREIKFSDVNSIYEIVKKY